MPDQLRAAILVIAIAMCLAFAACRRLYPALIQDVQIRIIELMDHVLSTYDRAISIYTAEQFKRAGTHDVFAWLFAQRTTGINTTLVEAKHSRQVPCQS